MGNFWDDNTTWDLARLLASDIGYIVERIIGLKPIVESGSILDIGCGDGKLIAELAKIYPKARRYGLSNRYDVAEARKNNPDADIKVGLIQNLPFENDLIQFATTSNTFDYAEESLGLRLEDGTRLRIKPATFKLEDLAREVKRVLVPGGIYILFEGGFEDYLSLDTWAIFERHLEPLHKETSGFRIFRKT